MTNQPDAIQIGPPTIGPIDAAERIVLLDVLRGFAIFGILVVNVLFFSRTFQWVVTSHWTGTADRIVRAIIEFFFTGKFYSLFSMLFGLGLAVQMNRAQARGVAIAPLYRRRLLVLLAIGLTHAIFIWYGDILHLYAILGFLLLWFRNRQRKTVRWTIVVSMLLPVFFWFVVAGFIELAKLDPAAHREMETVFARQEQQAITAAAEAVKDYSTGSYSEVLEQRITNLIQIDSFSIFFAPHIFAMLLLGLYLGRERFFVNVEERLPVFRKLQIWGLVVGVIGNAMTLVSHEVTNPMRPSLLMAAFMVFYVVGAPALMLFYVATITLAMQNPVWRSRFLPLASVGKMALSNYLLQSLICTTIFYSHGLGLFGRVHPWALLPLAVAIYAVQIPLSVWWMNRFRFGPAEWLWRTLTYGKPQAMRYV